ncbi:MAG: tetratricopeptide repeat protein, partial [Anaerolineae bacterium]|nr:tetratricopeptide repeat protein [Anaerolineae bacterium]
VAVTQSSLAALLSNRGQYEEAERLYQSGLAICYEVQELQGIGVFLLGLGQLAQAQGNPDEALAKFREAQQQFVAIGLTNWAAQVEQLIRQVQGEAQGLTLDDVLALIKSAQNGNQEAGQQAWQISQSLKQSNDYAMSALGQALESILAGESPETATTNLPPDLRTAIVQALT